jgi:hypothetical protein
MNWQPLPLGSPCFLLQALQRWFGMLSINVHSSNNTSSTAENRAKFIANVNVLARKFGTKTPNNLKKVTFGARQ